MELLPAIEDHLDALQARQRLAHAGDERGSFDDVVAALGRDPDTFQLSGLVRPYHRSLLPGAR